MGVGGGGGVGARERAGQDRTAPLSASPHSRPASQVENTKQPRGLLFNEEGLKRKNEEGGLGGTLPFPSPAASREPPVSLPWQLQPLHLPLPLSCLDAHQPGPG